MVSEMENADNNAIMWNVIIYIIFAYQDTNSPIFEWLIFSKFACKFKCSLCKIQEGWKKISYINIFCLPLQNYFARNFYNMRMLALFVAFAINFILLFYKVQVFMLFSFATVIFFKKIQCTPYQQDYLCPKLVQCHLFALFINYHIMN